MRQFTGPTLTKLHDDICQFLIETPRDELDWVSSVDAQCFNGFAFTPSMIWAFDLKNMWLTRARWTKMVRQYINRQAFDKWMDDIQVHIGTKHRGIAVIRTNEVSSSGGVEVGNKEVRRWGSCMLSISYRAVPKPQMTLHSRTSYLGYLSALDLSVVWVCARYLGQELGLHPNDFSFLWYNEAFQWHSFKSLAYLFNHPKGETYRQILEAPELEDDQDWVMDTGGLRISRNWMQRLLEEDRKDVSYDDMSFNTYRRIRRRYHTEVLGLEYASQFARPTPGRRHYKPFPHLPSVPVESLDFSSIGLPKF